MNDNSFLSPEARLLIALVLTLLTIWWHQLLYRLGLVEDDVNEHYEKMGGLYE